MEKSTESKGMTGDPRGADCESSSLKVSFS